MARIIIDAHEFDGVPVPVDTLAALEELNDSDISRIKMGNLLRIIERWIVKTDKPVVLVIDEVNRATNNQVFLDFLARLRDGYIGRKSTMQLKPFFQKATHSSGRSSSE